MKKALVTGITGQDGSYLAEILLREGYDVFGILRRASNFNTQRIEYLMDRLHLLYADLDDPNSLFKIIAEVRPDEIYNIGSQSHVAVSFQIPEYTARVTGVAPVWILEFLKTFNRDIKFYQASSSEMFGLTPPPQGELSTMLPVSPYGCAKLYAHLMTRYYRQAHKMFACAGILFNHESPRRGQTFVTQKIVQAAWNIKRHKQNLISLGNIDSYRDWGHAREYMEAVYKIMQQNQPDEFVIATGRKHTVREFAEKVFSFFDLNLYDYLKYDTKYDRPTDVPDLCGDPMKARSILEWNATFGFEEIVEDMCRAVTGEIN
jgi:GDPmannose 4,6-dehydratase